MCSCDVVDGGSVVVVIFGGGGDVMVVEFGGGGVRGGGGGGYRSKLVGCPFFARIRLLTVGTCNMNFNRSPKR